MPPIFPPKDLALIASQLQQIYRRTRAFKKFKQLTNIDIYQQSTENLLGLYKKLKTVYGLSADMQQAIMQEKTHPDDALTPAEFEFYKIMIDSPWVLNHASPQAQAIINTGALYSSNELQRRKTTVRRHTPAAHGADDFVYFSYSLPDRLGVVDFLSNKDIFLFNFNNYAQNPSFLKGMWTCGHFYAFDNEQTSIPRVFIGPEGSKTRLSVNYKIQINPLVSYQREWAFQQADNLVCKYYETREMTISVGAHIKRYHALKIILLLRFMGRDFRSLILANTKDSQLISDLFYNLFTPGSAELLVPAVFNFNKQTSIPTLIQANQFQHNPMYPELKKHLMKGDHDSLLQQLSLNPSCVNWYYEEDDYINLSLLNLAVLRKDKQSIRMLLEAGFNSQHIYMNTKQSLFLYYAARNALQDAIEDNDLDLVQQLCESEKYLQCRQRIVFNCSVGEIHMYTAIAFHVKPELLSYLLTLYQLNNSIDKLLLFAIEHDNSIALTLLLEAGANPNASHSILLSDSEVHLHELSSDNYTALTKAAYLGQVKNIQILLQPKYNTQVNQCVKEPGRYHLFGKGSNALLSALNGFIKQGEKRDLACGYIDKLDKRHILILPPHPQAMEYVSVMRLLLEAGAQCDNITGEGNSFRDSLAQQLLKNNEPLLQAIYEKLPVQGSKTFIDVPKSVHYEHEAYALISAFDANNTQYILVSKSDGGVNNGVLLKSWCLPGGTANYLEDNTLKDTTVCLAAYQTGIDLTTIPSQRSLFSEPNNVTICELHTFILPTRIEQCNYYKKTITCSGFERNKRAHEYVNSLSNTQFIPLKSIIITPVLCNGVLFPVCSFENQTLPFISSLEIVTLLKDHRFINQNVLQLAHKLHFFSIEFINQAIENGSLDELKNAFALSVDHFLPTLKLEEIVSKTLISKQYHLLTYLVDKGFLLSEHQIISRIPGVDDKVHHSEEILIYLHKTHAHLFKNDVSLYWAEYAAQYGYLELIRELGLCSSQGLINIGSTAVRYGKLEVLKLLSTKFVESEKIEWLKNLAKYALPSECINGDFDSALSIAEYLIPYYEKSKQYFGFVPSLRSQFIDALKNKAPLEVLQRYLKLFSTLIESNKLTSENSGLYFNFRAILYSVVKDHESEAKARILGVAEDYFNILRSCPMFALIYAVQENIHKDIDSLLQRHVDHPLVRGILYDNNKIDIDEGTDENGFSPLSRHVQSGNLAVTTHLLEACRNKRGFNIDKPDAKGQTLLMLAISKRHSSIVKLLIMHGAVVDDTTRQLIVSLKDSSLTAFINNKFPEEVIPTVSIDTRNKEEFTKKFMESLRIKPAHNLVIASESPFEEDNQNKSGDCDYAKQLKHSIERAFPNSVTHYFMKNTYEGMQKLLEQKVPITFHLMLNAPRTGFAVSIDFIRQLKQKGVPVIMTAIEFAKHQDDDLKERTMAYLQHADAIIFLDEEDKAQAIDYTRTKGDVPDALTRASVIPVPPTVAPENISTKKYGSHIMCFGMLRRGKGFGHIIHLAQLIKNSKNSLVNQKEIFVVGSVQNKSTWIAGNHYDSTLYTLLKAMYPDHADRFYNKSPAELILLSNELQNIPSALPIKLYLNVEEDSLPALFEQCEYSFYPAYRGATLRNSSISTSLAFSTVIYSHIGKITPNLLTKEGLYQGAMVLFDDANYEHYAPGVLENIIEREEDKEEKRRDCSGRKLIDLNTRTRIMARELVANELSLESVAKKHLEVYSEVNTNTNTNIDNPYLLFNKKAKMEKDDANSPLTKAFVPEKNH